MLRYGDPTLQKSFMTSGIKRHAMSRKKSTNRFPMYRSIKPEIHLNYEVLRSQTLEFLKNPEFDSARTFDRLEESIKTLVYHDRMKSSYSCAMLLELLYCCKYSYLNPLEKKTSTSTGFGATISHELDTDETLVIDPFPPCTGFNVCVGVENYRSFLPLLYKEKIYKIVNDPWTGDDKYSGTMYKHFVLDFYQENESFFKNRNVFVHPNSLIVEFFVRSDERILFFDIENIGYNFTFKILELPIGQSFIYLTSCAYVTHAVTLVMKLEKRFEDQAMLTLFFVDNNSKGSLHDENVRTTEEIREGLHREISHQLRSTNIKLNTRHEIIYPADDLNISYHNSFSYDGYCAAVSNILVYCSLRFIIEYGIVDVETMYKHTYYLCLAMKGFLIDDHNLWFFFVKSCILTTFIKHYDLDGEKPLKDQGTYLDIWSDETFDPSFFTNEAWERVNRIHDQRYELLDDESKTNFEHKPFPTLINNTKLNLYYVKLSHQVVQKFCVEALFGIVVYDNDDTASSYSEAISKPVNGNDVKYYVIKRKQYDHMFSPESDSEENDPEQEYRTWVETFVKHGMVILFESLSGKERLWLTRNGIKRKRTLYKNFHIIGIRKHT